MVNLDIAARFDAPPEQVWQFVSWEGVERLVGGGFFASFDYHERRPVPGAIRRCFLDETGSFIDEQLLEWAPDEFRYVYRLADSGPLPLTDYEGVVRITPAGGGCCLKFGHSATLVDTTPAEWEQMWLSIENQVFDFIRRHVETVSRQHL